LDEAENIGNCLKSLEGQTRRPDEVIVVDNGSVDDTGEIARALGAKVLFFPRPDIRHGNHGQVRQKGVDAAVGDVVVSADADCVYPASWLERISKHFETRPALAVVGGPVLPLSRDPFDNFLWGAGMFFRSYVSGWGVPYFSGANTGFTKKSFQLIGGYGGAGEHGPVEEWVLSFRLSRVGEWFWDDDLVCYTVVPDWWHNYYALMPVSVAPLGAYAAAAVVEAIM